MHSKKRSPSSLSMVKALVQLDVFYGNSERRSVFDAQSVVRHAWENKNRGNKKFQSADDNKKCQQAEGQDCFD